MSRLNPKVFLTDLTQSEGNTLSEATVSFQDTLDLDRAGTMGLSVLLGTIGANTILTARPPRGNVPPAQARLQPRPVLAEFSFSGSRSEIDHRAMIIKVSADALASGPTVGFDNDDMVMGLTTSQVDEMIIVNCPFYDFLNATPGEIFAISDSSHSTGLLPEDTPITWVKGVLRTTIGNQNWPQRSLLDWQGVLPPELHQLPVTAAFNGDTLYKALELSAKRVAGLNLGDGSLPGTKGHMIFDTSSPALNIGSELDTVDNKPVVVVGYMPESPFLDIVQGADPAHQDTVATVGDGLLTTTDLSAMFAQIELTGGKASQGLPVNAELTSGVIVNKHLSAPSGVGVVPGSGITGGGPPVTGLTPGAIAGFTPSESWQASLPIVGVFIPPYGGGAYYYPGDGAYYQMGSCPGIKELVYDEFEDYLYAATIYGVRRHRGTVFDNLPWEKVGKLRYPVDRVWVHRVKIDGLSYFFLFAQVNAGQAGIDGIWSSPGLTGEDEDAPGWQRMLNQPKIVAFTPVPGTLTCVFTIGDRPYQVQPFGPLAGGTATVGDALDVPLFENILRLDPGPKGNYYIVTGAGSAGLYMWNQATAHLDNLNPGHAPDSLKDIDGQPINVNRLVNYTDLDSFINGRKVLAIACTNRGLWFTDKLDGSGWHSLNGQSGLAGEDVSFMMVGGIRRIIDRDSQMLYAFVNGSEMSLSFSGGLWWSKTVDRPLEIGTAFAQLAEPPRLSRDDPPQFPDWDITAVGTGVNPAPGFVVDVQDADVQLPDGWQLARRETATNRITYRIVNTLCTAPYFGIEGVAVSDIYSGIEVSQADAELSLISLGCELLYNASMPQTLLTVPTWFSNTNAKLRKLRQGHMVTLTYKGTIIRRDPGTGTPIATEYAEYDHERFFVLALSRRMADGSSTCEVQLTLGKFLMTTPPAADELSANILYGQKNDRRYGTP